MKYTFFGTPEFSKIVLEKLIESDFTPGLVVCNPDRPVGRDQIMTPPPTKVLAEKHGIDVYQPKKLNPDEFKRKTRDNKFAILAAYGKIIPKSIIDYFENGIIGIHPSLLPKYRGPTPIRSAMLAGEENTGVSLFLMDEKIDNGPVISKETLPIDKITYTRLKEKLANLGAEMVVSDAPRFIEGEIEARAQNHDKATKTEFIQSDDAKIEYSDLLKALKGDKRLSKLIERRIRSLNPEPGAWTRTDENQILNLPKNKRVKLLESHLENGILVLDKIHVASKSKPRKV